MTHQSLEVHAEMLTWNPVITVFGREKVLRTAFRKNINLAKRRRMKRKRRRRRRRRRKGTLCIV